MERLVRGISLRLNPRGRPIYGADVSLPSVTYSIDQPRQIGGIEGTQSSSNDFSQFLSDAYDYGKKAFTVGSFLRMVFGVIRRNPMSVVSTVIWVYNQSVSDKAVQQVAQTQVEMGLTGQPDPYYISGQFTF